MGDCLINGLSDISFYENDDSFGISLSYIGDPGLRVLYWQFYDEYGNPYLKVESKNLNFSGNGVYTVEPVFASDSN